MVKSPDGSGHDRNGPRSVLMGGGDWDGHTTGGGKSKHLGGQQSKKYRGGRWYLRLILRNLFPREGGGGI